MMRQLNDLRIWMMVLESVYEHFKITKQTQRFPHLTLRSSLRLGGVGCLTALLAACASNAPQPQIPIAQEVAHYKANARSYYTPPGPPEDPWGPYIQEASARFDVPEAWIRAVMQQESGGSLYHNGQLVTSGPGAMGLMQLMPPTYDEMKVAYSLGDDAYDPHDNILAGTAYIRQMYDIYGSPGFLAAYNGGPGRLDDFLTHNRALPLETRRYVASIGVQIQGIKPNRQSQADLLVEGHEKGTGVSAAQYASAVSYRPVSLSTQAQAVQDAWQNRQATDRLNTASLNGVSSATTDSLNQQSLQSSDKPSSVKSLELAAATRSAAVATAMVHAPAQPMAGSVASANVTSQDIRSAWAARGFQQPAAAPKAIPVTNRDVQLASLPVETGSKPYNKAYYRPVSYQLPSKVDKQDFATAVRKRSVTLKRENTVVSTGNWGIQVGAFASMSQAHSAAGKAKSRAALHTGKQQVQLVRKGKSKVYRARVTGLSQAAAQKACRQLSSCILIHPVS